ncbi:MAG: 16S rRNA (cytosine(967)-C(5))-methyltransferase RsmB [Xanthomonadales bacterium]|jgi:16S rRNA (cytosine967-C5)-methyltransferase|nr:16S rRNA (cytosine(967)-C(5))-methyltransferase RsmB [Xanthomonadales bacterium]
MSRGRSARRVALEALGDVLDRKQGLADSNRFDALEESRDRAFARRLTFGVLRWKTALDWLADQLLQRPLRSRDRDVRRLILLGLYQLWKDDTADHAAVHATADTARALGKAWAVGLVNAVLRNFLRQQEALENRLAQNEARFAHPDWLLKRLRDDWPEDWEQIATANNRPAPLWLRFNAGLGERSAAEGRLREAGFELATHPLVPDAIALTPAAPVQAIPGFAEGVFSVQDPAAQLAAGLMDLAPGQRVLDACAAPGGKTGHLLEREPGIELLALDRSPERLGRVRENLDRLGLEARLQAADATQVEAWWDGRPFDRILLDAPCTALGVIRRHPDIKWLRTPEQIGEATALQARLLASLWPLLRPGGILVYATCSVLSCENNARIQAFLADQEDAACTGPSGFGRNVLPGRQILPGEQDMDGFYYAVLQKADL